MNVEKKGHSSNEEDMEDEKIHPASKDADELEALLSQVRREGARAALKEPINKLRAIARKARRPNITERASKHAKMSLPEEQTITENKSQDGNADEWKSIDKFYYSDTGYNKPTITVYIDFPGVGASKDRVKCHYTEQKFDLQVRNHNGVNYRMIKEPLEKDIVPEMCKTIVKRDKIKLKLRKKKGEYSYESWTRLIAKGGKRQDFSKDDPSSSLMSMMKDMYDEGDDTTKKMIGEAMLKSRMGQGKGLDKEGELGDDDL